ncbi:MAG: hypothetical protein HYU83_05340, partial [Chloroflexi bacterium]|nr:hypothetical protein [Chloroflexota bacterium]
MKRKFVWLVVSSLMVLSLILASCAPAAPTTPVVPTTPAVPTTPTAPAAPVAPTKPTPPAPVVTTEVPKYGGVFTFSVTSEQPTFDDAYRGRASTRTNAQTNMSLTTGDWSLGAAGTGAIDYWTWTAISTAQTGEIAESWEFLSDSEAVFHIRKGIYWALDPNNAMSKLVGGRELNAYDVEFTLKRTFDQLPGYPEPKAYTKARLTPPEHPTSIQATDKWTVVLKGNSGYFGSTFKWSSQSIGMIAPEVIKAGKNFTDPKNYVSNGPFMLTDYVAGTSITFARNANYWRKDPVGPGKGNQLPYLDGVKMLV